MEATLEQAYQGAIALNNMGVTLHERSCHRQALETLQDAVVLLRIASNHQRLVSSSTPIEVKCKIHQALQRLAKPIPSKKRSSSHFAFQSVTLDPSIPFPSNHAAAVLIRIEDTVASPLQERDIEVDSAILLHNYGVVCLSEAALAKKAVVARKLTENAFRLLNLSQTMLSSKAMNTAESDDEEMQTVLFVAMVVTNSMAIALATTGKHNDEAKACRERLSSLRTALQEMSPNVRMVAAAA